MLKFYAHPRAGYCQQRRNGDSVPSIILPKLIDFPQRFQSGGLVKLIEVCVRCISKLEDDPLQLLVKICNACRDDYQSPLHQYIPLIIAGQICREQRHNFNKCIGEAAQLSGSQETKRFLRQQFLVSYEEVCQQLKKITKMAQYYYQSHVVEQVKRMREKQLHSDAELEQFNQLIQVPIHALSQISFMYGFKANHTQPFLSFLGDLCFKGYACINPHNKCLSATLIFDLLHSIKERSKMQYRSNTRKEKLCILQKMQVRIYNSLIDISSGKHPDQYLSGHLLVLSLLNILCGRDFVDTKVINLLTFAIEFCEEDFKEIMLMFVKQFNKLESDFFPHNFSAILKCLSLLIKKNSPENIQAFQRFVQQIAYTLKQQSHSNLFTQIYSSLESSSEKSEKLAAIISMKYIKPTIDIYKKLLDSWKIISIHIEDTLLREKFIEALQYMYQRASLRSKVKECLGQYISDIKHGKNPIIKGQDLLTKNSGVLKESQFFIENQQEREEDEEEI